MEREGIQQLGLAPGVLKPSERYSLRFQFGDDPRDGTRFPTHHHVALSSLSRFRAADQGSVSDAGGPGKPVWMTFGAKPDRIT
jgi:hypothetical protein